jgi:uncharacterized protein YceK
MKTLMIVLLIGLSGCGKVTTITATSKCSTTISDFEAKIASLPKPATTAQMVAIMGAPDSVQENGIWYTYNLGGCKTYVLDIFNDEFSYYFSY